MIGSNEFPRLTPSNYRVTSPATPEYNYVAWSAADTEHWWQPGVYWPIPSPPDDYGLGVLEQAFQSRGYEDCGQNDALEPGYEKVALYGSGLFYTHVTRQLPSGKWTSKLGEMEDIEHDAPEDVAGGLYGEVVEIMRRPRPDTESVP